MTAEEQYCEMIEKKLEPPVMAGQKMTFNWIEIEKDGLIDLRCCHTQCNAEGKTRRIMSVFLRRPEEVKETKREFEANRKCVVEGGAWEPVEGGHWHFENNQWVIDESDIKMLGAA